MLDHLTGSWKMKVIIAGAGLAGLAAGFWAKKAGHDVTIFEASDRPGGRAKTYQRPGSTDLIDVGTQYFHSNYRLALSLIREMGLTPELNRIRGRTRFFDDRLENGSFSSGHRIPYMASGSIFQNVKLLVSGLGHVISNPINPYAVQKHSALDEKSVDEIVKDPFEWEYNVRALFAAGALVEPETGAQSYLQLIRLMRIIVMTDYLTLNRGIASLHEALARNMNIRYGEAITRIIENDNRIHGFETQTGEQVPADHLIVAAPPAISADLLPMNWDEEKSFLQSVHQPPAITVSLFLNKKPENKIWSYFFRPDKQRLVSFCVDAAQKNPQMVPSGNSVLQAWICTPAAEAAVPMTDADLTQKVVRELNTDFPDLTAHIEHSHVHRVERAIPQFPTGQNARVLRFLKSARLRKNISFCGDYLSGGYMESALWAARQSVDQIKRN